MVNLATEELRSNRNVNGEVLWNKVQSNMPMVISWDLDTI
jgi:hypothetical protein